MPTYGLSKVLCYFLRKPPVTSDLRLYSRWSHRTPSKILLPYESNSSLKKEKIIDLNLIVKPNQDSQKDIKPQTINSKIKNEPTPAGLNREKSNEIKVKREHKLKTLKKSLSLKHVFDENNELIYEKCNDNDGRISSLLVKLKSKKDRMKSQMVLVEGWRMIVDGLEANCSLKYLIFSSTEDLINIRPFLPKLGTKIYKVPYKEISMWSDVETSPGLFGVFDMPKPENIQRLSKLFPLQLVCDNIRVPGNLGAILRVAVGVGCEKVLLTKGCVDYWDSKVLRSAAGAHFRLPVHHGLDWEQITEHIPKDSSVFIADSNAKVPDHIVDEGQINSEGNDLPLLPYYGVDYASMKSLTLIVGGETEGISDSSYSFALSRNGLRLNIPLQKGVDSLNSGMATAVIGFEVKKQLLQAQLRARELLSATS